MTRELADRLTYIEREVIDIEDRLKRLEKDYPEVYLRDLVRAANQLRELVSQATTEVS